MKHETKQATRFFLKVAITLALLLTVSCIKSVDDQVEPSTSIIPTISPIETLAANVKTPLDRPSENQDDNLNIIPGVISAENANSISLVKKLHPYFPDLLNVSIDGKIAAIGNYSGIHIFNQENGEELMDIDVVLPDCHFGMNRYFQLNYDGSFIAFTTKTGVQVWQIGAGIVYDAAYYDDFVIDDITCGMDVPQIALSPTGEFLAESGMRLINKEMVEYFKVTNIFENEIVYEWEGDDRAPQGQFYLYPGLGFSTDGRVMQTFDPGQFRIENGNLQTAFRFWSTESWQELERDSAVVKDGFSAGQLQFAVSKNEIVSIYEKMNGEIVGRISVRGCLIEKPCEVAFSPDGNIAAVLLPGDIIPYKREPLKTVLEIYDLKKNKKLSSTPVITRNMDGIHIKNNGETSLFKSHDAEHKWWTNPDYFTGFYPTKEQNLAFIPQVVDYREPDQFYTGSCLINLDDISISCEEAIITDDAASINIEEKGEGFTIQINTNSKESADVDIRNPDSLPEDTWQLRFLDYEQESGTAFFCMDRNHREDTCVVMDIPSNTLLLEGIDLFGLSHSREVNTAAYIDREKKALFLFDSETKVLKKMRSYQAIAFPVKPVFLKNEKELIYMVQGLDKERKTFIERIDVENKKVIKRYDIDDLVGIEITALAVSPINELWAASDKTGTIFLISPTTEEVVHSYNCSSGIIEDLTFSLDGKYIFTIDRAGVISVWTAAENYKNR